MKKIAAAFVVLLAGCANPGIVPLSQDTFMLSRTDHGGILGNASAMKADVIQEANTFAASKGKVAVPLAINETPLIAGARFASIEYQFRLVDQNDPLTKNVVLVPGPNRSSVDVTTRDASPPRPDTYSEMIKLDDLRKRGILTDAEFETQKQKLLAR